MCCLTLDATVPIQVQSTREKLKVWKLDNKICPWIANFKPWNIED
jgi:hypothetical protein